MWPRQESNLDLELRKLLYYPLYYEASCNKNKTLANKKGNFTVALVCTTYGIRTRDSSVKGRRLNPLTNAAFPVWDCKDKSCFLIRKIFREILALHHCIDNAQELISFQRCATNKASIDIGTCK